MGLDIKTKCFYNSPAFFVLFCLVFCNNSVKCQTLPHLLFFGQIVLDSNTFLQISKNNQISAGPA